MGDTICIPTSRKTRTRIVYGASISSHVEVSH